jgi:two-component system cell cycle response regulator DivK
MSATVLVVEDTPANMKLALLLLQKAGLNAIPATNAPEAIELARRHRPDLILMDIQLPGMNGLDANRILKEDEATASIPVIALTALVMRDERERILGSGFVDYIAKPIQYRDFIERVIKGLPATPGSPADRPFEKD